MEPRGLQRAWAWVPLGLVLAAGLVAWFAWPDAGARAFARTARALRSAHTFRLEIPDKDGEAQYRVDVECPDRFHLWGGPPGSRRELIVIGARAFEPAPPLGWRETSPQRAFFPLEGLCSAPDASEDARDLAATFERESGRGALRRDGGLERNGRVADCFASRRAGSVAGAPVADLVACVDRETYLPIEVRHSGLPWRYSRWNEPMEIVAPEGGEGPASSAEVSPGRWPGLSPGPTDSSAVAP